MTVKPVYNGFHSRVLEAYDSISKTARNEPIVNIKANGFEIIIDSGSVTDKTIIVLFFDPNFEG